MTNEKYESPKIEIISIEPDGKLMENTVGGESEGDPA